MRIQDPSLCWPTLRRPQDALRSRSARSSGWSRMVSFRAAVLAGSSEFPTQRLMPMYRPFKNLRIIDGASSR